MTSAGTSLPLPHAAPVAAVFHLVPDALPFLTPGERAPASGTGLLRQMLLFDPFHRPRLDWIAKADRSGTPYPTPADGGCTIPRKPVGKFFGPQHRSPGLLHPARQRTPGPEWTASSLSASHVPRSTSRRPATEVGASRSSFFVRGYRMNLSLYGGILGRANLR
jgi:hypothetical protein